MAAISLTLHIPDDSMFYRSGFPIVVLSSLLFGEQAPDRTAYASVTSAQRDLRSHYVYYDLAQRRVTRIHNLEVNEAHGYLVSRSDLAVHNSSNASSIHSAARINLSDLQLSQHCVATETGWSCPNPRRPSQNPWRRALSAALRGLPFIPAEAEAAQEGTPAELGSPQKIIDALRKENYKDSKYGVGKKGIVWLGLWRVSGSSDQDPNITNLTEMVWRDIKPGEKIEKAFPYSNASLLVVEDFPKVTPGSYLEEKEVKRFAQKVKDESGYAWLRYLWVVARGDKMEACYYKNGKVKCETAKHENPRKAIVEAVGELTSTVKDDCRTNGCPDKQPCCHSHWGGYYCENFRSWCQ